MLRIGPGLWLELGKGLVKLADLFTLQIFIKHLLSISDYARSWGNKGD